MEYPVEYKTRSISVDDDVIEVRFHYDELCGVWLGDYPYFAEEPRWTPNGRPWMNACYTEVPMLRRILAMIAAAVRISKENVIMIGSVSAFTMQTESRRMTRDK